MTSLWSWEISLTVVSENC